MFLLGNFNIDLMHLVCWHLGTQTTLARMARMSRDLANSVEIQQFQNHLSLTTNGRSIYSLTRINKLHHTSSLLQN